MRTKRFAAVVALFLLLSVKVSRAQNCASLIDRRADVIRQLLAEAWADPTTTAALAATLGGLASALDQSGAPRSSTVLSTILGAGYCVKYSSDCARVASIYGPLIFQLNNYSNAMNAARCTAPDEGGVGTPPPPSGMPAPPRSATQIRAIRIYNSCPTRELIAIGYFTNNDSALNVSGWYAVEPLKVLDLNVSISSKRFFLNRVSQSDSNSYNASSRPAELPSVNDVFDYSVPIQYFYNRQTDGKNTMLIKDENLAEVMTKLRLPAERNSMSWFYSVVESATPGQIDETLSCRD